MAGATLVPEAQAEPEDTGHAWDSTTEDVHADVPHSESSVDDDMSVMAEGPVQPLNGAAARAYDAEIIAQTMGWDLQDTIDHLIAQEAFSALAETIYDTHPEAFSSSIFAASPGASSQLRFKGRVPSSVAVAVAASGLNVTVKGGYTMTFDELETNAEAIADYLWDTGYSDFSVAFNEDEVFEITIGSGQPLPVLPRGLPSSGKVEFDRIQGAVSHDDHSLGGASTGCTSGFSVISTTDNREGISGAGHCHSTRHLKHRTPNNQNEHTHSTKLQGVHRGDRGDMAWWTTPGEIDLAEYIGDFRQTARQPWIRYSVESIKKSFSKNDVLCVWGYTTKARICYQVYRVSVSQGVYRRLLAMDAYQQAGGDSGGPVSLGTQAAAVHKGWARINGVFRATSTKVKYFPNRMNVRVKTR